jgi:hypothetical protein
MKAGGFSNTVAPRIASLVLEDAASHTESHGASDLIGL